MKIITTLFALLMSSTTLAAPIDLIAEGWTAETLVGGGVSGAGSNWTVQNAPANDEVFQSVNGNASVFFDPNNDAQGTALSGKIRVETSSDDDFVGFVLGYDSGEINSGVSDFILIDWKQGNQALCGGTGFAGLAISRVTGANLPGAGGNTACKFWNHDTAINPGLEEIQRATNLGATGWADNTEYEFDLIFNSNLIEVTVNSVLELSITSADAGVAAFDDGSFGFYNFSQGRVRYSGLQERDVPDPCIANPDLPGCNGGPGPQPVPEPGTLGLIALGLIGMGLARRKRAA